MNKYSGPCLEHCYSRNNITYFVIGLITGIGLSYIYSTYYKKK